MSSESEKGWQKAGDVVRRVLGANAPELADFIPHHRIDGVVEEYVTVLESWLQYCESPIEAQLGAHMALTPVAQHKMAIESLPGLCHSGDPVHFGQLPFIDRNPRYGDPQPVYELWAQQGIGRYRVDFLACFKPPGYRPPRLAVIECDGHDFHERTKDQAARDRSRDRDFTEQGYTVLRFTGREISRNPEKCSRQVQRVLEGV